MSYQITCPKCKYEFTYNQDKYNREIERLGNEIHDIILQRAKHRTLPYNIQRQRDDWWNRSRKALSEKQKQLQELKALRKTANEHVNAGIYSFFRQLVREEIGEKRYIELIRKADEMAKSYNIADLSKHEYTTNKMPVTSINKL